MSRHKASSETTVSKPQLTRPPWKGDVLFACKKCQRKMKRHGGQRALGRLKKWFRRRADDSPPVHVIDIPCVKLCPKGGVTVFAPRHLNIEPPRIAIARSVSDLETLYCELTEVALSPAKATLK